MLTLKYLLPFLCLTPIAAQGTDPLFNGKNLDGWINVNCAESTWTVRDEMIVCSGQPTGLLRTDRQFQNFVLEVEWRFTNPGGNAGIFVWADPIATTGQPFTRSVEVQVMDGEGDLQSQIARNAYTTHGDVFPIWGATMVPDRPHPRGSQRCLPTEARSKPAGEWNQYKIICIDGTLRLSVNGKFVSGGTEINPRKGYICLEAEGAEVMFRNFKLTELAHQPPLGPDEIANVDRGLRHLFDGLSLTGFRGETGAWSAGRGSLRSDPSGVALWTEDTFSDVEIVIDVRSSQREGATAANESGVLLRGLDSPLVPFSGISGRGWHRMIITLRGGQLSATVDGESFIENRSLEGLPATGPIGLRHRGSPMQFMNLYARRL